MMSRPTDKPMARALAHLAAGRYAEAVGAFRAVLGIDSSAIPARLGLADALMARGQRGAAVEGLVEAAERCSERGRHDHALLLYGKALALDPGRIHLHLDVAVVEHAMGQRQTAVARMEGLAERYIGLGRTDEAAEILRFVASWGEEDAAIEELEPDDACTVIAANPLLRARAATPSPQVHTETVVCATVLVRPDGSLFRRPTAGAPEIDEVDPDMVTRVTRAPTPSSKPTTRSAQDTLPTRPRSFRVTPPPRPAPSPRAAQAPAPARAPSRPPAPVASPPAAPRAAQSTKVGTEPIMIRRPMLGRPEREDEVTHRFRHPQGPRSATAC